ncbi:MAG TPA: hypothetical protein PKA74_05690 [Bauldia sp.]|nr:hypothetical protein [Bauldia sp.]
MSQNEPKRDPPERIEAVFRTGSITVVGFLVAFSLGFLTAWGANPVPWGARDLPPYGAIVVGLIFELIALALLLEPSSLEIRRYRIAIRIFFFGLVLVSIGVVLALAVDFADSGAL